MISSTPAQWWESLSPQWQQAFIFTVLQHNHQPSAADLEAVLSLPVLRLAGPAAPHPNCNFELTDLSGITGLTNLQVLIVSHHALTGIREVASLPQLKSLFVFNNKIVDLEGIEGLQQLEQLYVNSNELSSIKEVQSLPQLRELFVNDNRLTSLEGLTSGHAAQLQKFVCTPNDRLPHRELIRVENELGILCR